MQITVPSAKSQTTTVSLPSGWTRNNCIIEQVYIFKFNGSNVYFSDTLASECVTFAFTGDSLTAITSASAQTGWFGDTANVILRRIVQ